VVAQDDAAWLLHPGGCQAGLALAAGLDISFFLPAAAATADAGGGQDNGGSSGGEAQSAQSTAPAGKVACGAGDAHPQHQQQQEQRGGTAERAVAALAVLTFPALQLRHLEVAEVALGAPYLPSFLGFRWVLGGQGESLLLAGRVAVWQWEGGVRAWARAARVSVQERRAGSSNRNGSHLNRFPPAAPHMCSLPACLRQLDACCVPQGGARLSGAAPPGRRCRHLPTGRLAGGGGLPALPAARRRCLAAEHLKASGCTRVPTGGASLSEASPPAVASPTAAAATALPLPAWCSRCWSTALARCTPAAAAAPATWARSAACPQVGLLYAARRCCCRGCSQVLLRFRAAHRWRCCCVLPSSAAAFLRCPQVPLLHLCLQSAAS
jgi:hypothetical protein